MVLLALSLALALGLITILGSDYVRASRNLEALTLYRKVLTAANRLSAERGPMNSVLGEEPRLFARARIQPGGDLVRIPRLHLVAAGGSLDASGRLEARRQLHVESATMRIDDLGLLAGKTGELLDAGAATLEAEAIVDVDARSARGSLGVEVQKLQAGDERHGVTKLLSGGIRHARCAMRALSSRF